jgi:hypothetical protein
VVRAAENTARRVDANFCSPGRIFLQSDVKEAATAMYEEFREHGGDSFSPDLSGAMLTEESLSASISAATPDTSADGSTASGLHVQESIANGSQLLPHQTHDQQDRAQAVPHMIPASAAGINKADQRLNVAAVQSGQAHNAGSSVQARWPPDIQWLDDNPVVGPSHLCVKVMVVI